MITLYLDMDGVLCNFDKAYRAFDPKKEDRKKFRESVMTYKIFEDLEAWHGECRLNLTKFDPKDLYRSQGYKDWQKNVEYATRKHKRENKYRNGN